MRTVYVVVGRGALAVAATTALAGCSITIKQPGKSLTTTADQVAVSTQATPSAGQVTTRTTAATGAKTTRRGAASTHATAKQPAAGPTVPISVGPPPFPGPYFHPGDSSPTIKVFQDQMHSRGYFPVGTGDYGPNTLAMVKRLQAQNGLIPNGEIGPNTWRLAWTGTYNPDATVPSTPADFSCTIGQDPTTLLTTYLVQGPSAYSGALTVSFYDSFGDHFDPIFLGPGSVVTGVWRYAPSADAGAYTNPTYCTAT